MNLNKQFKYTVFGVALALVTIIVQAQDVSNCPTIVQTALDAARNHCLSLGSNQACYGNTLVDADIQTLNQTEKFEQPGDIVDVINLRSLRLSGLNVRKAAWGIVLMQIPDSPSDVTADETLTYVFFGDVSIHHLGARVQIQITQETSLYEQPLVTSNKLAAITPKDVIFAISRTQDWIWLEVELADGQRAWLQRSDTLADSRLDEVPLYDEAISQFGPMQAFTLETNRDKGACKEAPENGVLFQTPEGIASMTIWIDGLYIDVDGTAFIRASAEEGLELNVLEGNMRVEGLDTTQNVAAGLGIEIGLDEDLMALTPPSEPEPYNPENLNNLPLTLLPRPIEIASPAINIIPLEGSWNFAWSQSQYQCPDGTSITLDTIAPRQNLTRDPITDTLTALGVVLFPDTANSYSAIYTDVVGTVYEYMLQILSPISISGIAVINLPNCRMEAAFMMNHSN